MEEYSHLPPSRSPNTLQHRSEQASAPALEPSTALTSRRSGRRRRAPCPIQRTSSQSPSVRRRVVQPTSTATVMAEPEPLTLTPTTRRISRAKKGKRVHRCDQCEDKVFTRAEHLRRHQCNHKSEARFRCEVVNCPKAFYRRDLLERHKERHTSLKNKAIHTDSESQRRRSRSQHSGGSSGSASGSYAPSPAEYNIMAPQPPSFPYMRPTMDPSTPSEQPIVSNQAMSNALLSPLSIPTSSGSHCVVPDLISVASDESPLTSSGSSGYSAVSDQFQPHFPVQTYNSLSRPRSTSTLSTPEGWYQVNKSPLPQSASISAWNLADATPPPPPQLMSPYDGSFYTSVGISAPGQISQERTQTFPAPPLRVPVTELDGNTFSELQCLMVGPTGLSMGPDGWCTRTMGKLDEYLDYYWQRFDKFIPIVHRPSFSKTKAPILVAIMAAIGALYAGTMESKSLAIDVHRRCKDFINTRPPIHRRSHVSDIQSVLLVEMFGKFRSRKIDVHLSQRFKDLYAILLHDHAQRARHLSSRCTAFQKRLNPSELHSEWCLWIELESKQRAVLSAYLLDAHQATFFEQEPCQSTSYYGQTDLLFACPTPLWESQNANEWSVMCQNVLLPNQPCLRDEMFRFFSDHDNSNNSQAVQTPFESSLILAYTMTSNGIAALDQVDERFRCRLEERYSSSHNLLLTCNSFQVLRYAPLRELLAVTGETWVLGRKLSSPSEFAAAKDRLRSWATSPAASKATWHAAHVLRHAFQSSAEDALWGGLSGGLHEQWCVYTAALVCWAFGSAQQAPQKSSASSSSSSSCVVPGLGHERTQMWHYLTSLNTESWDEVAEVPGLWRTGEMLLCVKELVRGTMGGLLKDAEEVLTRLIDGRLDALRF